MNDIHVDLEGGSITLVIVEALVVVAWEIVSANHITHATNDPNKRLEPHMIDQK